MDDTASFIKNNNDINTVPDDDIEVLTETQESVDDAIDEGFESIIESNLPCTFDHITNNSLLIELHLLAVACCEATPSKYMKVDEKAQHMHAQSFSNSTCT